MTLSFLDWLNGHRIKKKKKGTMHFSNILPKKKNVLRHSLKSCFHFQVPSWAAVQPWGVAAGSKAVGLRVCLWAVPEQQETGCRPLLVQTGAGLPEETLGKEAALVSASRVVITNGSRKRNDLSSLMTDKAVWCRRWSRGADSRHGMCLDGSQVKGTSL